jgi:hypothetical protein
MATSHRLSSLSDVILKKSGSIRQTECPGYLGQALSAGAEVGVDGRQAKPAQRPVLSQRRFRGRAIS